MKRRPVITIKTKLGPSALDDVERKLIREALRQSGGNITHAAATLGVFRQCLQRKLKRLRLS